MNPHRVSEVLERLADARTSTAEAEALMARLDGRELQAVAEVFRAFHEAESAGALHAATMLLARWRNQPVAEALAPALRALIDEDEAGDLHKLAAADLLAHYGQPIDDFTLADHLADPAALAARMLNEVLAGSDAPAAVIGFLDRVDNLSPDAVLELIDDLAEARDERALPLLAPLAHSANADLAIAAVGALDRLIPVVTRRSTAATLTHLTLSLVADHHRDAGVRREADLTLARWPAASFVPPGEYPRVTGLRQPASAGANGHAKGPAEIPARGARPVAAGDSAGPIRPPRSAVFMSEPGEAASRLILLVWPGRQDPSLADALVIYVTIGGVHEYATTELMRPADLRSLLERLSDGDVELSRSSLADAEAALIDASAATLAAGGASSVGYAAWPQVLALIAADQDSSGSTSVAKKSAPPSDQVKPPSGEVSRRFKSPG